MSLNPKGQSAPEAEQGNVSPEETEQPKFMTVEEFNRGFTAMKRTLEKQYEQRFTKLIEEKFLQSQPPQFAGAGEIPNTNPTNPNPPIRVEDSPQFRDLRAQLEDVKKGFATAQAERDSERQRAQDMSKRTMVQERLQAAGITGPHLKFATNEVLAATRFDEESNGFVFGEGHEALPFDSGVKNWLKTDDAKALMPARGVTGSGAVPGSPNASRGVAPAEAVDPMKQFLTMAGLIPSSE